MQRKAVAANTTDKPLSPIVMVFEFGAWLMGFSQGGAAKLIITIPCDLV
jgi:hypothetical protein